MSMTPIHKIPQGEYSLHFSIAAERDTQNYRVISLHEQIEALICHTEDENHLSITMDWAMQIRSEFGISWSESIDLAMTFYFG